MCRPYPSEFQSTSKRFGRGAISLSDIGRETRKRVDASTAHCNPIGSDARGQRLSPNQYTHPSGSGRHPRKSAYPIRLV